MNIFATVASPMAETGPMSRARATRDVCGVAVGVVLGLLAEGVPADASGRGHHEPMLGLSVVEGADGRRQGGGESIRLPVSLTSRVATAADYQVDPLKGIVSIVFEPGVQTVRDATLAILGPIGYELLESDPNVSPLLAGLLESPLPIMQREVNALRAEEALRMLAGTGFIVVVDPVHRRVTYDPRPVFRSAGERSSLDRSPSAPPLVPALSEGWVPVERLRLEVDRAERGRVRDAADEQSVAAAPETAPASTGASFAELLRLRLATIEAGAGR